MIFVDTAATGWYLKNDQHHGAAIRYWATLQAEGTRLLISNFVLDEALTLLARRTDNLFAAKRIATIYASSVFSILRPDVEDELHALELFQTYADQRVSFADCVSFALMRRAA